VLVLSVRRIGWREVKEVLVEKDLTRRTTPLLQRNEPIHQLAARFAVDDSNHAEVGFAVGTVRVCVARHVNEMNAA